MGNVAGVSATEYPRQGGLVGKRVRVCYHYDTENVTEGVCIRDDMSAPYETILQLDNGRVVRGAECQYQQLSLRVPGALDVFDVRLTREGP